MSVVVRTSALGHLDSFALAGREIERVALPSDDLAKRVVRCTTSKGEIGLRFEGAERLHDGDIIFADERLVIAVVVEAEDLLLLWPATIDAAIRIAHALGNRHLPIQTADGAIVVRFDPLLETLAGELGIPVTRERRVIAQPFRHAHAPHRHE